MDFTVAARVDMMVYKHLMGIGTQAAAPQVVVVQAVATVAVAEDLDLTTVLVVAVEEMVQVQVQAVLIPAVALALVLMRLVDQEQLLYDIQEPEPLPEELYRQVVHILYTRSYQLELLLLLMI